MDNPERKLSLTVVPPDIDVESKHKKGVDHGWAWIVLGATFTSFFTSCGLCYNIGIFFVSFLDTFNESKSYTAWIGAVYSAIFQITGPISSLLLPYFGARQVLIFGAISLSLCYALLFAANSVLYVMIVYGLFGGVGCLFVISGSVASIVQYFDQRLFLASGIMSAGGGLGIMVVGLATEYLIEWYGWRGCLLLLSGISLHICVCGALVFNNGRQLKRRTKERKEVIPEDGDAKNSIKTINWIDEKRRKDDSTADGGISVYFRDIRFWYLNLTIMSFNMASSSVFVFFKDIMIEKGLGHFFKVFLTCMGIGSMIGRGASGFLSNYLDPNLFYFVAGLICAVDIYMITMVHTQWAVILVASLLGICHGSMAVLQTLQVAHVFGYEKMAIIWGYGMGFGSVSVLIGPPLGGWIADVTGNYNVTILFFAIIIFVSGFFAFLLYVVQRNKKQKLKEEEESHQCTRF